MSRYPESALKGFTQSAGRVRKARKKIIIQYCGLRAINFVNFA